MPRIIPIKDLKNTSVISQMCSESAEPIYVTKNGYGDMVIMSMKAYEDRLLQTEIYEKLAQAEEDVQAGRTKDAWQVLQELREAIKNGNKNHPGA